MNITSKFLVCIVIFNMSVLNAQTINNQNDTLNIASLTTIKKQRTILHKSIVPLSLIGIGLVVNNSQFEKNLQTEPKVCRHRLYSDFLIHQ